MTSTSVLRLLAIPNSKLPIAIANYIPRRAAIDDTVSIVHSFATTIIRYYYHSLLGFLFPLTSVRSSELRWGYEYGYDVRGVSECVRGRYMYMYIEVRADDRAYAYAYDWYIFGPNSPPATYMYRDAEDVNI
jgi:hypothetical protein